MKATILQEWKVAVGTYQEWPTNLGKAAKWLNPTELESRNCSMELGIPLCLFLHKNSVRGLKDEQQRPGDKMMKAGSDAQWHALSKEVLNRMKKGRMQHLRATLHAPVPLEMLAECDANFILTYPDDILSPQLIYMAGWGEVYRDEVALVKEWKKL